MGRPLIGKRATASPACRRKRGAKRKVVDKDRKIAELEEMITGLRGVITRLRRKLGKMFQQVAELQEIADLARRAGLA